MAKYLKKILLQEVSTANCVEAVKEIVENIREQDKEELEYCGIEDLHYALTHSVGHSAICYVAKNEKQEVLCIFGISATAHPELGRPVWLIGSKKLLGYSKEFVVHSRQIIDRWLEQYGQLFNYVSETNTQSIRWLKSIGAIFYQPIAYGEHGEKFSLFIIERKG